MPAAAPIPTQSEPPTLADECGRVWRCIAGLSSPPNLAYLVRRCRLPAGTVRRALRTLMAQHHVTAAYEDGATRYRVLR